MSLAFCQCGGIKGQCGCNTETRKTTTERGYGHDWQKLSRRYRRLNPLCQRCTEQGRVTPADHVHHIVPIADNPSMRLIWSNLMALCVECHEREEAGR